MIKHLELELGESHPGMLITKLLADGVDLLALGIVRLELIADARDRAPFVSELRLTMGVKHVQASGPAEVPEDAIGS